MSIPFTQFMRPDGYRVPVTVEMPPDVEEKAKQIIAEGFAFEIEVLMTGAISMEICREKDEVSLAMEICENGPPVLEAITRMVNAATKELAKTT